ncbi:MAG: UDP-N-acetylglucosamine 2-epimerase, partial [Azoarcus sp.]|nr:UDP-N-acetylglucosamine 2-epimerase [Azoarcus sp.]
MSGHPESLPAPIVCVVGTRPNTMKVAPILRAFAAHRPSLRTLLVHTGQHYDAAMKERLFADLALPAPDVDLAVGAGSHAVQTAEIMCRFDATLDEHHARAVLVVGDVNSTLACALVAAKRRIPVIHVEAGLRSHDRSMPEEINRALTDRLADVLYTSERGAADNLRREGIDPERIEFV